jgi:KDO2-lipid IV(A) lauroyltransferase
VLGDRDGPRAWLEYVSYRAVVGLTARLPARGRNLLANGLAAVALRLERRHSAGARAFLATALGDRLDPAARERLLAGAWRHLLLAMFEDAGFNRRVIGPSFRDHFSVELAPDAAETVASGRGGFLLTAHVGMWEAGAALAADLGFSPLHMVVRAPRNRPLSRFVQETREARGLHLIGRTGATSAAAAVVESGGWVGLAIDQRPFGRTVVAPFFGVPAHCERLVAVLARRLERPIVFAACYRTDRPFHYRVAIDRVIQPRELASLDTVATVTRINQELERLILHAPEQYLWFHDRYRGAPPSGSGKSRLWLHHAPRPTAAKAIEAR